MSVLSRLARLGECQLEVTVPSLVGNGARLGCRAQLGEMDRGRGLTVLLGAGATALLRRLTPRETVVVSYRNAELRLHEFFETVLLDAGRTASGVPYMRLGFPSELKRLNQRRHFRVRVRPEDLGVIVGRPKRTHRVTATVVNISEGGVCLVLRRSEDPAGSLRRAARLVLRFTGPAVEPLAPAARECMALVRRAQVRRLTETLGLEFEQPNAQLARALRKCICQRQQEQLRSYVR